MSSRPINTGGEMEVWGLSLTRSDGRVLLPADNRDQPPLPSDNLSDPSLIADPTDPAAKHQFP